MKYFMLLLVGFWLTACNSTLPPAAEDSTIIIKDTVIQTQLREEKEGLDFIDTATRVEAEDFEAILYPLVASRDEGSGDTLFYGTGPGENMEGVKIRITSDKLTDIRVEEQLETHMVIFTEEGLYELYDWKHGYTTSKELLKDNDSTFIGSSFSVEDYQIFPEVTLEEVKTVVKERGGEKWLKLIKDVKTVKDDPLVISGDTYHLRISGKRKSDGKIITKIITVTVASGC
jgi:hypothetical protein